MGKLSKKSDRLLRVRAVRPLAGYRLELDLTDGTKISRDFSRFVGTTRGVLKRLRDPKFFARVRAAHGTVEWPGGIDLCPDEIIQRMR